MKIVLRLKFQFVFSFLIFLSLSKQAGAQNFEWVKGITAFFSSYKPIITDAYGNVYITGSFLDTIDIDPSASVYKIFSHGGSDVFFGKFDSGGNFLWGKNIGGTGDDYDAGITVDVAGNVILTGSFNDTADFDPSSSTYNMISAGAGDVFFAKYNGSGQLIWAKRMGNINNEFVNAIRLDANENIVLAGNFSDTVDFDPGVLIYNLQSAGSDDIFFAKYDPQGNFIWAKNIGGANYDGLPIFTLDNSDNIFLVGQMYSGDFDPGPATYTLTNSSIFFVKYDPNGNFLMAKGLEDSLGSVGVASSITVDLSGNIYISGGFYGTVDFDPGIGVSNIYSFAQKDIFFAKYTYTGDYIWAKSIGDMGDEDCTSLSVDISGNIYIGGRFDYSVDFDPGIGVYNLVSYGNQTFFAKYSPLGNMIWAKNLANNSMNPYSPVSNIGFLQLDDVENVYMMGYFDTDTDFDTGSGTNILSPSTYPNIFFAKYSQDPCSNMTLSINSKTDVTCSSLGTAKASTTGGTLPYNFSWNTIPSTTADSISTSLFGVYTVIVSDGSGCSNQRSVIINGPAFGATDLNANLIAEQFRPNNVSKIIVDGYNDGCSVSSGTLTLILDTMLIYGISIPSPSMINGDTLIWNFTNLTYDSVHISPEVYVTTPFTANIGDTISLQIKISPYIGDADTLNNNKIYQFPIVNSYDPNIKQVYPQGKGITGKIAYNQTMTYSIQFQNTGTADAININIDDTLDTNLDIKTLHIISSSDSMITEIIPPGNIIRFKFDNIHLPDSTTNESQSHGYLIYEVNQKSNLTIGTQFFNTAYIYFDYNPAVVTNTTINTIEAIILPVGAINKTSNGISIYPNPVEDQVTINFEKKSTTRVITLTDIQGRTFLVQKFQDQKTVILNTKELINGFYLIKITESDGHFSVFKIIKN